MIWLVGAGGMLGSEVRTLLELRGLEHHATGREETDITSEDEVLRFAQIHRPSWIINCAAYTAVDRAESEEERAYAVNALGPKHLARATEVTDARLIHVSTDYVFSGRRDGPYAEDASPDPVGAYGRTKEAGEAFVRASCARHFIVRTAWLHGPHGQNFVASMLRLMAERPELGVVNDQRGSPTYAADLADAVLSFIAGDQEAFGTYHYTNEGVCTWHAFAEQILSQAVASGLLRAPVPINAIASTAYPTAAIRPANSSLSNDRIRTTLGLSIPTWQDGLARHLGRLKEHGA